MKFFKLMTPSTKVDITRWAVSDNETSIWEKLMTKLETMLNMPRTSLCISWFDGEDFCTIHGQEDLDEAIRHMQSSPNTDGTLRIYASRDETAHPMIFGYPSGEYQGYGIKDCGHTLGNVPTNMSQSMIVQERSCPPELSASYSRSGTIKSSFPHFDLSTSRNDPYGLEQPRPPPAPPRPNSVSSTIYSTVKDPAVLSGPVIIRHTIQPKVSESSIPNLQQPTTRPISIQQASVAESTSDVEGLKEAVNTLKKMGFSKSNDELEALVIRFSGDVNKIIDYILRTENPT